MLPDPDGVRVRAPRSSAFTPTRSPADQVPRRERGFPGGAPSYGRPARGDGPRFGRGAAAIPVGVGDSRRRHGLPVRRGTRGVLGRAGPAVDRRRLGREARHDVARRSAGGSRDSPRAPRREPRHGPVPTIATCWTGPCAFMARRRSRVSGGPRVVGRTAVGAVADGQPPPTGKGRGRRRAAGGSVVRRRLPGRVGGSVPPCRGEARCRRVGSVPGCGACSPGASRGPAWSRCARLVPVDDQ